MPRLLSVALLGGCLLLAVVAATSAVSDTESNAGAAAQVGKADGESRKPTDCVGALAHFSGDHDNARYIIWRESRNDPTAQNERSTAAGCYQILAEHAWRFAEVGCSWERRYEPVCNTLAADHLYRDAGWAPWSS